MEMFYMPDNKNDMVEGKPKYITNDFTMPEELVNAMLSIADMTNDIVRAIPEELFRTRYLPMFVSTELNVDMSPWLDICGTAYEPVNVVKSGAVLFVVPPLVKRHPTIINVDSRFSAATIVAEARQYQERHPTLGVNHIVDNLSKKVLKEGVNMEDVARWNTILRYYGYPTIGNLTLPDDIKSSPPMVLDDDDFEEA
jgi:hypothetical protein